MAKPLVDERLWAASRPLLPPAKPRRKRYPGRRPLDNRQGLDNDPPPDHERPHSQDTDTQFPHVGSMKEVDDVVTGPYFFAGAVGAKVGGAAGFGASCFAR